MNRLIYLTLAIFVFLYGGAYAQCTGTPAANTVCAGPSSGGSGFSSWRALVGADIPSIAVPWVNITGTPTTLAGYGVTTVPWADLTGTPTTLTGYGITNARTALAGAITYYVNGNSAVTSATTVAGNAILHFAAGSSTTNATTSAANNVLHFASVPVTIYVGATITDSTASVIPAGTTVTAITQFTVTLSANVTGGGVGNGDTIKWSLSTFFVGQQITDSTASVIPNATTISSIAFSTTADVTISANVTGGGVGNGDTIQWGAACGSTGASTCGIGSDSNNGTAPATPFLTTQAAVNAIIFRTDLAGFGASVTLAHGASTNYAAHCDEGPVVGLSVFQIVGDSNVTTAVGVVVNSSGAAFAVKDLCTVAFLNMSFYDRPTNNGVNYISVGTGAAGHVDVFGLTFNSMTIGTFVAASYPGATITFTGAGNQITGGANAAFSTSAGGMIDFSGVTNSFTVTNNLTWGTSFMAALNDGEFNGVVALGATGTFGNPSGQVGLRCTIANSFIFSGVDPNLYFPGGTNCVPGVVVGAIGIASGSGVNYGSAGNCLVSGGGSGTPNSYVPCAGSGVPQNNLNTQSGNYSIQTTDCGATINETGAMKTITLPAVAGFATNCVLSVYNANATRGQLLSGFPGALSTAPNNVLWPTDTVTVQLVNGAWSLQAYPARHKITASITVFVDNTNGNDANDCLASTTSACKTIQGAINYVGTWDGNTQAILVSVADGTDTTGFTVNGPFHGNPSVTITGDTATPANCIISTTAVSPVTAINGATFSIGGFTLIATVGNGIVAKNASFVTVNGAMVYGAIQTAHISSQSASTVTVTANYTISGGAQNHWNAFGGTISAAGRTITTSGTPAFSTSFANAQSLGLLSVFSNTFSGTGATGPRFSASLGGVIFTNQTSATYFPGNASGTIATAGTIDSLNGVPTASGSCSVTTQTGGNLAGTFTASGACVAGTYILTFGAAAPAGWSCNASDRTTPADTVRQTASTTTSATFAATTANSDVVSFSCTYY
jgi:hypothetical protein